MEGREGKLMRQTVEEEGGGGWRGERERVSEREERGRRKGREQRKGEGESGERGNGGEGVRGRERKGRGEERQEVIVKWVESTGWSQLGGVNWVTFDPRTN